MHHECDISIITVNYNGLHDTCAFVDSIPFNDYSLEVIVVDNASTQDEAAILEQRYPHILVIRSPRNLGFAGGNNLGITAAHGKYIFLINNDTIFDHQTSDLRQLIHRLESDPSIAMVCPKIRFAWGTHQIQYAGYTPLSPITMRNHAIGYGEEDCSQYDAAHPTPYAHGAAMMVKREAIEKVGLMPECFFLYYEELDWSLMFTRAGFTIWYEPACTIYHKESQSTGQNSSLKTYYMTRNRLLFVKRNSNGITKYLSYIYLIGIVGLRDIINYSLTRQSLLTKAVKKGLVDFIKNKYSNQKNAI